MRIWSNFVIKVICIYIADMFHSPLSPLWDYTHIFLDIQISLSSKLLMYGTGFCSHDIYKSVTPVCLNQGWRTFLTYFGSYIFPTPAHSCVLDRHHELITISLLLSADVTSELSHLSSRRQAYTFTIGMRTSTMMAKRVTWLVFVVSLFIPSTYLSIWHPVVKQYMFVLLMRDSHTHTILSVIWLCNSRVFNTCLP